MWNNKLKTMVWILLFLVEPKECSLYKKLLAFVVSLLIKQHLSLKPRRDCCIKCEKWQSQTFAIFLHLKLMKLAHCRSNREKNSIVLYSKIKGEHFTPELSKAKFMLGSCKLSKVILKNKSKPVRLPDPLVMLGIVIFRGKLPLVLIDCGFSNECKTYKVNDKWSLPPFFHLYTK